MTAEFLYHDIIHLKKIKTKREDTLRGETDLIPRHFCRARNKRHGFLVPGY